MQIISGYTATAAQKEVSEIEKLYRYKCSLCHELPDIEENGYTYQQWLNVMNAMHQPGRYRESVNEEDDALIKFLLSLFYKFK
jgi:cytochrome c5